MASRLLVEALRVVPRKGLSRAVRRLASVHSKMAVRRFAAQFELDMSEAEHPLEHYDSVLALFTRRLKPGLRPVDPDPDALVSPVDGAFLVAGDVEAGTLVQAKGRTYRLTALLADPEAERTFGGGAYVTVYLAPRDYHRIHAPVDGRILGFTHVPGDLFPVNASGVAHVDALFATNERVVTHLETERFGRVDVVKVGATNVGHIRLAYDASLATNTGQKDVRRVRYDTPIPLARGDELGVFELGSTVIVLTERRVRPVALEVGAVVKLGMRLGAVCRAPDPVDGP